MGFINKEQIVGWYNGKKNHFFCDKCFSEERDIEEADYEPVMENEIRSGDMFICDVCGEKFTEA